MRRWRFLTVLTVVIAAHPALATAQSLGEVAEREKQRRAKQPKGQAPTYGEADLATRRGERSPAPAASPTASPSAGSEPQPARPGEDEATLRQRQAEWRTRFAEARERVFRAEADSWRTVVDVVWVAGIPVQQLVRKFEETEALRQAKQALADLEEEYRRTGLPPGWVR